MIRIGFCLIEIPENVCESAGCFPGLLEYAEDDKLRRTHGRDADFDNQAIIQNVVLGHGLATINLTPFCSKLEELAADGVYEFLFVFTPVPFKGATGSPGPATPSRW